MKKRDLFLLLLLLLLFLIYWFREHITIDWSKILSFSDEKENDQSTSKPVQSKPVEQTNDVKSQGFSIFRGISISKDKSFVLAWFGEQYKLNRELGPIEPEGGFINGDYRVQGGDTSDDEVLWYELYKGKVLVKELEVNFREQIIREHLPM